MIESATVINLLSLLTTWVIHSAPTAAGTGAVSTVSGKVVSIIWDRVKQYMQQGHEPVNELHRAVRKVYLQATLEVCKAAYKKWGVAAELRNRSTDAFTRSPIEIQERIWVDKVWNAIQCEMKEIEKAEYKPPYQKDKEETVQFLLHPEKAHTKEVVQKLKTHLKQNLLRELRCDYGEPPALFVDFIEKGWVKAGKQTDWLDCLYTFFIYKIQNNQGVANIFNCEILKKLTFNDLPVISEKIDVLLEAIAEERGVLLQELHRRSLYQQYAGRDIAEKVENISKKYLQLFVGREGEFQCIDEFIQKNDKGVLLVTGGAGYGKSALLANWKEQRHEDGCFVAYHCFNYRDDDTRSIEKSYRNLLRQLYIYYELEEREIPDNLDGLQDMLLILKDRGTRENEPLIIIFDGLDEVKERNTSINAAIFSQLPQNAFILASVRSQDGEKPAYLPSWLKNASTIQVKSLPREAICSWIERFGSPRLSEMAQDTKFINTLYETTQGFPLHLEYLIKDLSEAVEQGNDVQEVLAKTPHGFQGYVEQQINSLNELNLPEERWLFFALLTVAKGILREEDIKNVTGMRDRHLQQLKQFWQVTRWMHISEEGYAFAHPLLANLFSQYLKEDANEALQKLLLYCAKWPENQSFYVLRHYAKHLREAQLCQMLYDLARDSAFAILQRERLPEDPDLPLETIREALLEAAEKDDAGKMAEFLLLHSRQREKILQESPLDALRKGSVIKAWQLADLYYDIDTQRCILWYLLLAWELKDEGRLEEAEETLQKLQQKDCPHLLRALDWQGDYAASLLTWVFEVSSDICEALYPKLFKDDEWKHLLSNYLINTGGFTRAIEVVKQMNYVPEKIDKLERIAKAQQKTKDFEGIRITLATAIQFIEQIFPHLRWADTIAEIAKIQVKIGDQQAGKDTLIKAGQKADTIKDIKTRIHTLVLIATHFSSIGEINAALEILEKVEEEENINDFSIFILIAEVQLQCGETEKAKNTYARAKAIAHSNERYSYNALVDIAQSQARIKDWDAAFETTEEITIKQEWYYSESLFQIAKKQLQEPSCDYEKIFQRVITTIDRIESEEWKSNSLQRLAESQAMANMFDDALKSAQRISWPFKKSLAFSAIAIQQAKAGQFEEAFNTIEYIKDREDKQDSLRGIAKAYAQGKQFASAIEIALMLNSRLRQVETLGAIAKIQVQFSQNKDARDTLARGLTISQSLDPSYLKAFALMQLAEEQVKSGDKNQGFITVDSAYESAKKIPGLPLRIDTEIQIAKIYKQLGKSDRAKDILEKMKQAIEKIGVEHSHILGWKLFSEIAKLQARIGEFEKSLDTINHIYIFDLQVNALKAISQLPLKVTEKYILNEILDTKIENAKNSFLWNEVQFWTNIAVAKIALGEPQIGLDIFDRLCEQAKEDKNCSHILSQVAAAQAEAGEIALALATVKTIEDNFEIVKALQLIASFQWEKGHKDGIDTLLEMALKARERIQDKGKQLEAMVMILQIQVEAGKGEEAIETVNRLGKDRNHVIAIIASLIAKVNDRKNFKQLLVPAALSLERAYPMCGYLAQLYPEQAAAVAEQVERTEV